MKLLCALCTPICFRGWEHPKTGGRGFAGRYYVVGGVGIRFYADNLERELLAASLSPTAAMAFDSSAAISPMKSLVDVSLGDMIFSFELNDESVFTRKVCEISQKPEKTLAAMSEYYMLKIGDFLFCGGVFRQRNLSIGDHLRVLLDGECLLDFQVK